MGTRAPAVLVLESGTIFIGEEWGAPGIVSGWVAVSDDAEGWERTLSTDQASGKILLFTAAHVGNTGLTRSDLLERGLKASGVVVSQPSRITSHYLSSETMENTLREAGIVGICRVDTRAVVKTLTDSPQEAAILSGDALRHIVGNLDPNDVGEAASFPPLGASGRIDLTTIGALLHDTSLAAEIFAKAAPTREATNA